MDSVLLILFCSGLSEGQDLFQLLKVSLGKVMYVFFFEVCRSGYNGWIRNSVLCCNSCSTLSRKVIQIVKYWHIRWSGINFCNFSIQAKVLLRWFQFCGFHSKPSLKGNADCSELSVAKAVQNFLLLLSDFSYLLFWGLDSYPRWQCSRSSAFSPAVKY